MTATPPPTRYLFSGHAIGASAQFHRLDDTTGLDHLIPTQAASVLPQTGGLSHGSVSDYSYTVNHPRPRTLFSVSRITSTAAGRIISNTAMDSKFETEVEVDIHSVKVVDKLRIDLVRLHMLSTFDASRGHPVVTTRGNRIDGVWLGNVHARIELDDEPVCHCGTRDQLAALYRAKDADYRQKWAWRFATPAGAPEIAPHGVHYKCSLVRGIELVGPETEKQHISVDGYTIVWKGFGRIILGEIHVKGNDRQLTMVRLAMGSDAGGSGSVGDGKTNGATGT
jgi:hypothetical protein